jgi:hypothetical protein
MFGMMQAGCGLPATQREEWMGHICGLCLALRQQAGHVARLTTNYDAALLLALWQAQTNERPTYDSLCPLRRRARLPVAAPDSVGAQFAAALAVTMGGIKLADQVQDNDTAAANLPWLPSAIAHRWQKQGQQAAAQVGFDTAVITGAAQQQAEVEAIPGHDFLHYAWPTELSVGAAFGHTAVLAHQPHNQYPLTTMGQLYGRIMFLIDSYQDHAVDLAHGRFNALAAAGKPKSFARDLFQTSYAELAGLVEQVAWKRPSLIRLLLIDHLGRIGSRLLDIPSTASSCAVLSSARKQKDERDRFCDACCDVGATCGYCVDSCCTCCDCCNCCTGGCDCCDCDCG